ncbi:hypothetical protein PsorP6_006935 [Peronosclerospora sorghi]|uniref:Uncharacterized protein n=1 Tax=Peronosclerospora sorghi TaxID=230839 RepID=A0ACC0W8J5_9STRA|nr:hypothetical protein PsorP6_006935 [Peronosclerospora sorghi]
MKNVRPAATPMEERYRDRLIQEQDLTIFKPRLALGDLLYMSVHTRPDISTAVRLPAQETERPTAALRVGIENVFCYLRSAKEHGLVIRDGAEHNGLVVYCDAAFAVERERKSSTGFAIFYDGNLVEWGSKEQGTLTLSSTEAEYIAMATGLQECIGIMLVLKDLGIVIESTVVMEDNQGAQHLAESKGVTQRSRHIDTKYHWLREKVSDGLVRIQYCTTSEMIAGHFTKPLKHGQGHAREKNKGHGMARIKLPDLLLALVPRLFSMALIFWLNSHRHGRLTSINGSVGCADGHHHSKRP